MVTDEAVAPEPRGLARRIFFGADGVLRSGWALAIFFVIVAAISWPLRKLGDWLGVLPQMPITYGLDDPKFLVEGLYRCGVVLLANGVAARVMRRRLRDVGFVDAERSRRLAFGALAAVALLTMTVASAVLTGHESLSPAMSPASALRSGLWMLALFAPAAAAEELAVRGFAFQQLRRGIGAPATVLLSGAIFGLAHAANPNATWIAVANISLCGWLFGLILLRTGSLWFPVAFHTFWNWSEGFLFGQPVSGVNAGPRWLAPSFADHSLWTGGDFGPEASLPLAVLMAIACVVLLVPRPTSPPHEVFPDG